MPAIVDVHKRFCMNLRRIRTDKGLSQSELARRLGTPSTVVCQLESGRNIPNLSRLQALSEVLEVDASEFLSAAG